MSKMLRGMLLLCFLSTQVFAQTFPLQAFESMFPKDETTIYVAKKIITMEDPQPTATAVAVYEDHIVAVGNLAEVKKSLAGQNYKIDNRFAGKVIMPGLIDPHLHLFLLSFLATTTFITPDDWDFPWAQIKGISGRETYMKKLRDTEKAMRNKKEWLITWGYHQYFHGKISRKDLDAISLTRPIVVWHRSFHEIYLNTAAINAMKITKDKIKGHGLASKEIDLPNGHFWESGFIFLGNNFLMSHITSPLRFYKGLKMCKEYISAGGQTTISDPGLELPNSAMEMIRLVFDNDRTPFRSLCIASGQMIYEKYGAAKALEETEKRLAKNGHRVAFQPKQVKLFCDGAAFSQLMQLKDGYTDGHKGAWIQTPEELEACARLYWNAGYQIRVHVNGDKGNEVLIGILDKLEKENPRSDHRFTFDHYCVSTPDQAKQIAELGGLVSVNPYYVYVLSDLYSHFGLWRERAQHMVRTGSLVKNNIPVSLHSDTTMAPAKPLYLAWCAVNRLTMSGKVAGPEEKISVKDALKAITINAAYVLQKEKEIGSITSGKLADFTILEQDPTAVAPKKLKDIPIWGVVFEGKIYKNKYERKLALYSPMETARLEIDPANFNAENGHDSCACNVNQLFQRFARAQAGDRKKQPY
ncbi:MAG: amidohydrolase [Candidatus Margulisiibacteriota bacterium]